MIDADQIIRSLNLRPLEGEGGFFVETWQGPNVSLPEGVGALSGHLRPIGTAIYYLITPDSFSVLHRLRADEMFHFYLGDPCEMLLLGPSGQVETRRLGTDLAAGMQPQVVVPAGWWQGTKLHRHGRYALLGTTMAPGFHQNDFELAPGDALLREFPDHRTLIEPYLPQRPNERD